jgi:Protein of unknown function (DUF1569)
VSERRRLKFADADAVAAEVRRLRSGYTRVGEWSLPQMCWHLGSAIEFSMRPPPHKAVKAGIGRKVLLLAILMMGRIPAGAHAPDPITPAKETPESTIDDFFTVLERLKNFTGKFAPNPMFGHLTHGQYLRLHLIHCAHHLGFLRPANC